MATDDRDRLEAANFSRAMERYWEGARQDALEIKDSHHALELLRGLYDRFSESEKPMADEVLCAWVLSDDEDKRFAAMHLISHFGIARAVPALEQLSDRLESSDGPGARFEREKAQRIARKLPDDRP